METWIIGGVEKNVEFVFGNGCRCVYFLFVCDKLD